MQSENEKKADETGTVQHAARVRRAKEAKEAKKNFEVNETFYKIHGKKIIRCDRQANGNVKTTFAGTKLENPSLFKKIQAGK